MRALLLAISLVLLSLTPAIAAGRETAADHYHWRPVDPTGVARPWVILLPGSSGLSVLGDDDHYFRAARWFNARGVDALVVDYHGAARFVGVDRDGPAGPRMAAIVADAVTSQRAGGRMPAACPGAVIGWSLGAEGVWSLVSRDQSSPLGGLRAGAVYYPTVRQAAGYGSRLPVLALQGEADNVTPSAGLAAFVAGAGPGSAPIEMKRYASAHHGFDIASLSKPRSLRFPPLVGPVATFGFNPAAAGQAATALEAFLTREGVMGGVCAAA